MSVDPVTLEIVQNAVTAVAERISTRMIRSANSPIVKEMEDCSAALFDGRGRLLGESANVPMHLNSLGVCLKTILEEYFPTQTWRPGDVVITNDPYAGSGSLAAAHANDFLAFYPVYLDGALVAFTGLMVHHLDIGSMWMGTRGWGVEIYQEGFRVPPLKIIEEGKLDNKLMALMLNNTRVPDVLENDLISQISSVQTAGEDLLGLFRKYGADVVTDCFDELIAYSERRTRAAIETIPDGTYSHEEPLLDDGAMGGPFWLRLKIVKKGSEITFDFTGTDGQIQGPINSPLSATYSAVYYVIRCLTDPTIPSTEGCRAPIHVIAPEGSIVNAQKPTAVMQRMVTAHSIVDLIMGALADAIPEKVMGDSCGCGYNHVITTDPDTGTRVVFGESVPGGMGATALRDGLNVMSSHVTNFRVPTVEATEIESPMMFLRREFREDASGAGRWRGGTGQVTAYKVLGETPQLHHTSQKSKSLPQGFFGAGPGDGGRWVINEGVPEERVLEYAIGDMEVIAKGDTVTHHGPGGGGYGLPHEREPWRVQADARDGLISLATAKEVYGLRLDPKTFEVADNLRPTQSAGK